MKSAIVLTVLLGCVAAVAVAQSPSSALDRGSSLQAWQNPGYPGVLAKCKNPLQPQSDRAAQVAKAKADPANAGPPPEAPPPPASTAIPGVIAAGQTWKVVWSWEGNNADGIIAGDDGTMLFANNDASNVMKFDPSTGLATIIYRDTNTGGALSRSKNGALFLAARGLGMRIEQLEPQRKMLANSFHGEPLECAGGGVNDLVADARGGVYFSGLNRGVLYANPQGVVSQYGEGLTRTNGIILSPDEKTLYVTNGAVVVAFDVKPEGSLTNQREFASCAAVGAATAGPSMRKAGCMWRRERPWMSSPRTASSSAAFRGRGGCMARPSAVAIRRRSSPSFFTGRGVRRARETGSSRFR